MTSNQLAQLFVRYLTTDELGHRLNVKARSIRARVRKTGTYFGLKPVKGPNRLLYWAADSGERLLGGAQSGDQVADSAQDQSADSVVAERDAGEKS